MDDRGNGINGGHAVNGVGGELKLDRLGIGVSGAQRKGIEEAR